MNPRFAVSTALYFALAVTLTAQAAAQQKTASASEDTRQDIEETAAEQAVAPLEQAGPSAANLPTLTLAEAQKKALENNPTMRNLDEQLVQARATVRKAWARLLPQLSANGQIVLNQEEIALEMPTGMPGAGGASERIVIQEKWGKSFGFSANMPLLNAQAFPAIKVADRFADRARHSSLHSKNELLFLVTTSYYQVASAVRLVDVQREVLANAENFLRQSEALTRVGQGTELDVSRAELRVMDAQKNLDDAKDTLKLAQHTLGYLIGVEGPFSVTDVHMPKPEEKPLNAHVERALENRKDLEAAQIAVNIAELDKKATYMKWVPVFDVTYTWSWNSAAGFAGDNAVWMLIFGARWNIFEGGARFAELDEKRSQIRVAKNNLDQLRIDIKRGVDEALVEIEKRARNVELAQKQVELAQKNHHMVSRRYEVGLASSLDVLSADTDLSTKRTSEVLEQLRYEIAVLSLQKAAGDYHELLTGP